MTVDLNAKLASINLQLSESATQELLAHSNYCSSYEFVQEILIILSSTIVTGLPTQNIQTLDLRLKVLSDTAIASLLEYFAGVQKTIQKLLYFRDKLTSDDFELEFQETVSCFLNDFHAKLLSMQIRMRSEPNERYSPIWLQGEVKRAMDALKYCEYCIDIGILNGITNIVKKDHAWIFLYLKVHKLVFSKMDLMLQNCTETTIQTCNECILLLEPALSENLKKLVAIAQGTCLLGLRTDLEYSLFDKFVEILCSKYPQIHDIYLEKDTSNVSDFRFDTWLLNQLEYQYIKVCRSNLYLENFNPVKPAIVLMADCAESLLQPIVSNSYKMMHIVLYEEIKIGDYIKTLFGFYLFLDSIAPTRFYQLVDTLLGNSLPDLIHEIHEQVQFQCSDGDLGILENCEFELKSATKDSLDIYDILIIDFKVFYLD